MPIELTLLGWSAVLGIVQLLVAAYAKRSQDGLKWAMGARDEQKTYTGIPARLDRAEKNFLETFPYFVAAVLATYATSRASQLTGWGAEMYFVARVLYVPLYAFGVPVLRSIVWGISLVGIILVLGALVA